LKFGDGDEDAEYFFFDLLPLLVGRRFALLLRADVGGSGVRLTGADALDVVLPPV
jgi:hypothetical protein